MSQSGRQFRISRVTGSDALAEITGRLLAELPTWFGIPEANTAYRESATTLPGFLAESGGEPIGVLLLRRHFPEAAEIHLMAVAPAWHRHGVGCALVEVAAAELAADDCRLLQVKTLGPSASDAGYAKTRAFYLAMGFLPVEETDAVWPGSPCLIMLRTLRG